jgi:hypothetical protein
MHSCPTAILELGGNGGAIYPGVAPPTPKRRVPLATMINVMNGQEDLHCSQRIFVFRKAHRGQMAATRTVGCRFSSWSPPRRASRSAIKSRALPTAWLCSYGGKVNVKGRGDDRIMYGRITLRPHHHVTEKSCCPCSIPCSDTQCGPKLGVVGFHSRSG